jgi:hypothetical protein
MRKFDARTFERELVAAGYMPTSEYVRRWGRDKDEALSSRAPTRKEMGSYFRNQLRELEHWLNTNAPQPKANTWKR